ncbi:uncharacterized protein LOC114189909 [Vigna unguiculata]|uniref:uncharacterized protein LOC114189909 n=1 Tax=Vigna unguiculata TaxID=3917 RepID=UPI001016F82E|nr:uncharacterized protein LOC114189909 [Vigna unguiculata]
MAPLSIKEFPALVEKARQKVGGPSGFLSRHEDRRKPYSRPQPHGPRRFSHQPQQPQFSRPQCYHCGRPYLKNACPQLIGKRTCHRCGQEGHFIMECPASRSAASRPPAQSQSQ